MNDITDVTQFLTKYYSAFSTLDVEMIAPFFHDPCIIVSPQGVQAMPTHNDVKAVFSVIADTLRSKGYGRSELINLEVQRMSDTASFASGIAVRYKTNGEQLERVGVTYILQKSERGWRIAVTVIHDASR